MAVKTVEASRADVVCFKALLAELKVMTYIGRHANIVSLIGACTENIRESRIFSNFPFLFLCNICKTKCVFAGKLYIVVEFCPLGNLEDFLRSCRCIFVSQVFNGEFLPKREKQ